MTDGKVMTVEIDGRTIEYSSDTEFLVQVGANKKSSYRTKYRIVGNASQAWMYYTGINIGYGFKKRLVAPSMQKPTLARAQS